jgi:glutathione peroxidase
LKRINFFINEKKRITLKIINNLENKNQHSFKNVYFSMKKILLILITVMTAIGTKAQSKDIYDYSFMDINGNEVSISSFKGKKIMFVNVASKCGFTPQYEELQEVHEKYGDKVVIIGFPCNQFGGQEPGTEEEIQSFCQKNYGVEFLMASKVDVKGSDQNPIYTWLTSEEKNGVESSKVMWNFQKYIVDENGMYIAHFKSGVKPTDAEITDLLK